MRIVLIAAQSLDGFITKHAEPGTAFTSPEDKAYFRTVLAGFDVGIFGGETYRVSRDFIRAQPAGPPAPPGDDPVARTLCRRGDPRGAGVHERGAAALAADLRARGFQRCALLGGSHVHSLFFEAGLVDEVWLTVEPVLFGGGTPLLARRADLRLELQATEKLGAHALLLKYRVPR